MHFQWHATLPEVHSTRWLIAYRRDVAFFPWLMCMCWVALRSFFVPGLCYCLNSTRRCFESSLSCNLCICSNYGKQGLSKYLHRTFYLLDGGHIMHLFWTLFAKTNIKTWKIMEKRVVNLLLLSISHWVILLQSSLQHTMQLECLICLLPSGLLWLPCMLLAFSSWFSHQRNHLCQKAGASSRSSPKNHLLITRGDEVRSWQSHCT